MPRTDPRSRPTSMLKVKIDDDRYVRNIHKEDESDDEDLDVEHQERERKVNEAVKSELTTMQKVDKNTIHYEISDENDDIKDGKKVGEVKHKRRSLEDIVIVIMMMMHRIRMKEEGREN